MCLICGFIYDEAKDFRKKPAPGRGGMKIPPTGPAGMQCRKEDFEMVKNLSMIKVIEFDLATISTNEAMGEGWRALARRPRPWLFLFRPPVAMIEVLIHME